MFSISYIIQLLTSFLHNLAETAPARMDEDLEDIYTEALNQPAWESQNVQSPSPDSQLRVNASQAENVGDVEATPKFAVDEPANVISSPPPSKQKQSRELGDSEDSGMLIWPASYKFELAHSLIIFKPGSPC